jgi:hypothetical protein
MSDVKCAWCGNPGLWIYYADRVNATWFATDGIEGREQVINLVQTLWFCRTGHREAFFFHP